MGTPKRQILPIIHLNGLPGTGKLTIGRILADKINVAFPRDPSIGTTAKLVHNHLLINPADAILDRTQPGYQDLRKSLRGVIFHSIITEPATFSTAYIFTDFQSGDAMGSAVCKEFETTAIARSCILIPIILTCEEAENVRRLSVSERIALHKLTDKDLLLYFRRRQDAPAIYLFGSQKARLELDVTGLTAEEAAGRIYTHILQFMPEMGQVI